MKNLLLIACIILGISGTWANEKEKSEKESNDFEYHLGIAIDSLSHVHTFQGGVATCNFLKRIEDRFPNEWLTTYYIGYLNMKLSLFADSSMKKGMLDEAQKYLAKLLAYRQVDRSELSALNAYYYYVLIASKPEVNGPIYYRKVIEECNKAIRYNKQNPRAHLILSMFKNKMNAFQGGKQEDYCHTLERVESLFQNAKTKKYYPSWGMDDLKREKTQNCTAKK
ncbi:hypothetical protein OAT16_01350 [Prolixibacteraceae bacterium]|nr:hypothetical protein [Prolixibacteraceae bacterium]